VDISIVVDADTGYGNPLNVIRTVNELIDAGAAGCFLEDQAWPKRCGHIPGKRVIDRGEYIEKTCAAAETRGDRDFFIVARTDAVAAAMQQMFQKILEDQTTVGRFDDLMNFEQFNDLIGVDANYALAERYGAQ